MTEQKLDPAAEQAFKTPTYPASEVVVGARSTARGAPEPSVGRDYVGEKPSEAEVRKSLEQDPAGMRADRADAVIAKGDSHDPSKGKRKAPKRKVAAVRKRPHTATPPKAKK